MNPVPGVPCQVKLEETQFSSQINPVPTNPVPGFWFSLNPVPGVPARGLTPCQGNYDFTDSPHLSNLASKFDLSSELKSDEILEVTNTTVLGFFDSYLKEIETNWLDKLNSNDNIIIKKFNKED